MKTIDADKFIQSLQQLEEEHKPSGVQLQNEFTSTYWNAIRVTLAMVKKAAHDAAK